MEGRRIRGERVVAGPWAWYGLTVDHGMVRYTTVGLSGGVGSRGRGLVEGCGGFWALGMVWSDG